jgi:AraC family transcriptional regulator, carnitine catabolism transcriptional activator
MTHPLTLGNPIGFLLLPQFTMIALSSAIEPLRIANRYIGNQYRFRLLSLDGQPVPDGNGIHLQVDGSLEDAGALGCLIVVSDLRPERFYSVRLRRWLYALDRAGCTLGGLDTGCFILARAGLLDRQRVTLHWEVMDSFQERFPKVNVHSTLFEIDQGRMSSAGGSASLDMMLHAIGLDHGMHVAHRVADHCLHRGIQDGASGQRHPLPMRTGAHHPTLVKAISLLEAQSGDPIPVARLARELEVSERHLLRLFQKHIGESPAAWQMRQRLNRARALLIQTDLSITVISGACGFASAGHFSTAFRREFGNSPSQSRGPRGTDRLIADQLR